jgi:hypothetical protein
MMTDGIDRYGWCTAYVDTRQSVCLSLLPDILW